MRKDDQQKQRMNENAMMKPMTLDAKQRKQNKYKSSSRALGRQGACAATDTAVGMFLSLWWCD